MNLLKLNRGIIPHLLYVLIYLISFFVFNIKENPYSITIYTFIGVFSTAIYINYFILAPRFLLTKKFLLYIVSCLLTIYILTSITFYVKEEILDKHFSEYMKENDDDDDDNEGPRPFKFGIFFIMFMSISSLARYSKFTREKEKETLNLTNEKLNTELKFLKHQINPHFLLNTLNNIYSLVIRKSDDGATSLIKLSEMLRYMLYESDSKRIFINDEIKYIQNYISLQELRDSEISEKISIVYDVQKNIEIEPMLLISFIENAFKHSVIESDKKGFINIKLMTTNTLLNFEIENSIPKKKFHKDKVGGIGLDNVKRRLDILYSENYTLQSKISNNKYLVNLKIKLL